MLKTLEDRLVAQAADGNFAAFEELVLRYQQPLWRFALRLLGNSEDAQDAVQQILVQVHKSLKDLEDHSRFRAWLFTIARNKCYELMRSKSILAFSDVNSFDDENNELGLYPDPAPLPDEIIERKETRALLLKAMTELPERARQVVALRYSTDLSFAEIAEVLNLNENTTRTLFQRAKAQLRLYLRQNM
jgi:RNA polymerase sigma factor (sigma-70 family)